VFSDAELRANIGQTLGSGRPWAVVLGIFVAGIGIAANIWRWSIFLQIQGLHVPPMRLTRIFLIGMAFNLLGLGSIGGDTARVVLLMRDYPGRGREIMLSIFADHLSGLVSIAFSAAFFAGARYEWFVASKLGAGAFYFTIGFVVISIGVLTITFLAAADPKRRLLPKRLPWREKIDDLAGSYALFSHAWRRSLLACAISFIVLFGYFGAFYCGALAFDANVKLFDIFAIMPVVDVLSMIPVSVSGLGLREVLFEELLGSMAGTAPGVAVLISLTGWVCAILAWSIVGGVFLPFHRRLPQTTTIDQNDA
jgi:uncharacterized membrane protein YbhN (UPF0104 family)